MSIILSYYYHSRRRQERAKWALRVSDGDVREVRTDRERETRSGRTVVLGSFPPSLRPVILPSRRSGGSEEPSDRREERTRAWGTERRRDERDGGKGRNGHSYLPSLTSLVCQSLAYRSLPFPTRLSPPSVGRILPPSSGRDEWSGGCKTERNEWRKDDDTSVRSEVGAGRVTRRVVSRGRLGGSTSLTPAPFPTTHHPFTRRSGAVGEVKGGWVVWKGWKGKEVTRLSEGTEEMSERRSLPWPGSAGRDGEGPWWDGRMTARSSLLSLRPPPGAGEWTEWAVPTEEARRATGPRFTRGTRKRAGPCPCRPEACTEGPKHSEGSEVRRPVPSLRPTSETVRRWRDTLY